MSRQSIVIGCVFWLAGCALHAWYYVTSILALPGMIPDAYARTVGFQLLAFAIVRLPFWIIGLVAFLAFSRLLIDMPNKGAPGDGHHEAIR